MKLYSESIGNPHKKNAADPIESAGESETKNNVYSESDLPTAKAASFRLNHPWVVEVKEGYLCGLCHDASQTKKLNLETGTKYFVGIHTF